jgi:hypothetical protein
MRIDAKTSSPVLHGRRGGTHCLLAMGGDEGPSIARIGRPSPSSLLRSDGSFAKGSASPASQAVICTYLDCSLEGRKSPGRTQGRGYRHRACVAAIPASGLDSVPAFCGSSTKQSTPVCGNAATSRRRPLRCKTASRANEVKRLRRAEGEASTAVSSKCLSSFDRDATLIEAMGGSRRSKEIRESDSASQERTK